MLLVYCSKEYWEFVRNLRLDVRVTSGFLSTKHIGQRQQIEYMKRYSDFYRIALVHGEPAGYVGVVENDIRVCTHPDYQGRGVGKFLIKSVTEIWPEAEAKVKIGNSASSRLFLSCGFIQYRSDNNFLYYKKI